MVLLNVATHTVDMPDMLSAGIQGIAILNAVVLNIATLDGVMPSVMEPEHQCQTRNTKGGSITVLLTSCLTGLGLAV